ncbi:MAG TPA: 3-methylornithyl-N6-L-lysine dehydrogenase PylD [Anaerovoracaceae bacterium]|nr:3-methylornithyl-N6-L-lysine dehydrogenase PylD [Anaerovoracaceae bacterium]
MTRLITDWIADIENTIKERDKDLKSKTGLSYAALAAKVSGCSANDIDRAAQEIKVAAVPVTVGLGIIGTFAQSVAAVTGVMGFQSFVTKRTDVDGMHEAYQNGADIVFMADDNRFISINLNKKKMADNDHATALGYTAAFEGALKSLVGKKLLLMGCGALGKEFIKCLKKKGTNFDVYDIDPGNLAAARKLEADVMESPDGIRDYQYLIDATSQGGWLRRDMLHPDVWIAAPGIPLSLDREAFELHAGRIIHDPLQIGVAAMLGLTL